MRMESMTEAWVHAIREVLSRRGDRRFCSAVRRGIDSATETYAYPYILPLLREQQSYTPVLRAAALAATFTGIPVSQEPKPLGRFFYEVSRSRAQRTVDDPFLLNPAKPDAIGGRLAQLVNLDLEPACAMLRTMLSLAEGTNVSLDYLALTRTLLHWGAGVSESSQRVRRQLLRDYYGTFQGLTPSNPDTATASV